MADPQRRHGGHGRASPRGRAEASPAGPRPGAGQPAQPAASQPAAGQPAAGQPGLPSAGQFRRPPRDRAGQPGLLIRLRAGGRAPRAVSDRTRVVTRTVITIGLFAAVLAIVAGVITIELTHRLPAARAGSAAQAGPAGHSGSAQPSGSASRAGQPGPGQAGGQAPGDWAFLGSPAQAFATGAAGILPPAPHPAGPFSARQVGRAYGSVKRLLSAAHLDPGTLLGGPPAAFTRLLTPAERRYFTAHLARQGLTPQGWPLSTRAWVTSFAPGSTQLSTGVVKVHGSMQAAAVTAAGHVPILQVKADYLFVYAVQRPGHPATRMRIVVRDVVWVDFGHWGRVAGPLEPWWSPRGGGTAGAQCGFGDGYIHPAFPGTRAGQARPSGPPVNPYDQSVPPRSQGCQATTGT